MSQLLSASSMQGKEKKGEVGSAEIYFAKKLANNDKKVRDKCVKQLKLWIGSKIKSGKGKMRLNYYSCGDVSV